MPIRIIPASLVILSAFFSSFAAAPRGIPRELARLRAAQISNVRYRLAFVLIPKAATTSGEEEVRFRLKTLEPVLLDFRDGQLLSASVNGAALMLKRENGHLELPRDKLQAGENTIRIRFAVPIAGAGKPLTRFEDHDDSSEYIYSLFVPMDASMAFPCFDQPDLKGRFTLELTAPETWTVISNTSVESVATVGPEQRRTRFAETLPISTYLFALAAGPFRKLLTSSGTPVLYVRKSKFERAQAVASEVQQIAARGAQYVTSQTHATVRTQENVWKRIYESIQPDAYVIDSTKGTTPIYQEIPNLEDAKSAYGAIVYSKAPAVLKQLAFVLGAEKFRQT